MRQLLQTKNTSTRNAVLAWLAVAFWAALIFFLSAQPSLQTNLGFWDLILRKAAHVAEYAVLCLLLWNAVWRSVAGFGLALTIAGAASLLYAGADELHQRFVPGRTGTPRDVVIDAAGIITMGLIIMHFRPQEPQRLGEPAD